MSDTRTPDISTVNKYVSYLGESRINEFGLLYFNKMLIQNWPSTLCLLVLDGCSCLTAFLFLFNIFKKKMYCVILHSLWQRSPTSGPRPTSELWAVCNRATEQQASNVCPRSHPHLCEHLPAICREPSPLPLPPITGSQSQKGWGALPFGTILGFSNN